MQVKAELDKLTVPLGNNGINFKISDNAGAHLGDLRIGRATVVWMKGKTSEKNGKRISMKGFLAMLDEI